MGLRKEILNNTHILYNYGEWTTHEYADNRFVLKFISWGGRQIFTTGNFPDEAVDKMLTKLRGMLLSEIECYRQYKRNGGTPNTTKRNKYVLRQIQSI